MKGNCAAMVKCVQMVAASEMVSSVPHARTTQLVRMDTDVSDIEVMPTSQKFVCPVDAAAMATAPMEPNATIMAYVGFNGHANVKMASHGV